MRSSNIRWVTITRTSRGRCFTKAGTQRQTTQQRAIYDQGCKLIVSHQIYGSSMSLISGVVSRMLVRSFRFHTQENTYGGLYSRPVGAEWLPPCPSCRIQTRQSQRLPPGHAGGRLRRDRVMDQRLQKFSCILAQRACRDGQIDNRSDCF